MPSKRWRSYTTVMAGRKIALSDICSRSIGTFLHTPTRLRRNSAACPILSRTSASPISSHLVTIAFFPPGVHPWCRARAHYLHTFSLGATRDKIWILQVTWLWWDVICVQLGEQFRECSGENLDEVFVRRRIGWREERNDVARERLPLWIAPANFRSSAATSVSLGSVGKIFSVIPLTRSVLFRRFVGGCLYFT